MCHGSRKPENIDISRDTRHNWWGSDCDEEISLLTDYGDFRRCGLCKIGGEVVGLLLLRVASRGWTAAECGAIASCG